MNIKDFKYVNDINYIDLKWIEFVYNEVVTLDVYGLHKLKKRYANCIKTIIDIGSNLGVFSVFARELFPESRIISLEAMHDTYVLLKQNTQNYNIETYNIALGDGCDLYLDFVPNPYNSAVTKFGRLPSNIRVSSKTLKNIFEDLKIEAPYVIKMDIEGSELFLYEDTSCIDILRNCCYFTMEYHNMNTLGYTVNKSDWDKWLSNIFVGFDIDGLGGDEQIALYKIIK